MPNIQARPGCRQATVWRWLNKFSADSDSAQAKRLSIFEPLANVAPGTPVCTVARVSSKGQWINRNHHKQRQALTQACRQQGVIVRGHITPGTWISGADCEWLSVAVRYAKSKGAKALVATNVERFIRSEHYQPDNDYRANVREMKKLQQIADGLRLITVIDPGAELHRIRSEETK